MSTLVVADDDALFRSIMKRHLGKLGFTVIEEASGRNVRAQIENHRPLACLIDIVMDEKEGLETITELAGLAGRPKLIAVSSQPFYLELATTLGADATLTKPVAPDELKAALHQLGIATA